MSFYYVEAGEGPPLVLLHPAPFDHGIWVYQLLLLSRDFRVIAIDQRCFGRSSKPETPFALTAYAEDLVGVLDALRIDSIDVIGMSLGGIVAQFLALDQPERVRRMVLVSTTASTARADYLRDRIQGFQTQGISGYCREAIETFFRPDFRASVLGQSLIESFARHTSSITLPSLMRFYEALIDVDITQRLRDIRAPVLVVVGSEDFTRDQSHQLATGIPGARLAVVPECGRCVPIEAPGQFNRLVQDFLVEGGPH
jgi:3-oxoadipate enol-lactonase